MHINVRRGYIIDGYQMEEMIGSGGFSTVYKARSVVLQPLYESIVAVKVLHPRRLERSQIRRFVAEAKISMTLNHPNIVTVHNIRKQDGNYFIIMEFLSTDVLKAIRSTKDIFSQESLLEITKRTAEGLAYIHQNGIIHKDINPSNILISNDLSKIKLTDFGLSEKMRLFNKIKSTGGTEGYWPPEIRTKQPINQRSDIYSFGKTIEKIYSELGYTMPYYLKKLITMTLKADPMERPADMGEFINMLYGDY